jgi:CheY-like chemotaxis protein
MNVDLMEAMLPVEQYDILRAYNGLEAVEKATHFLPDIILLDIMMPEMNGYQVTRKLKNDPLTYHIPIVLVTALNGVKDKVKGLDVGADDFLSKPLDRTELAARVNSLLKVKAYHDHLLNYQKELEAEVARRTEKLAAELVKRKETEAQLIQAQKMEAIGTLAGGIAHDFNNILASIMGYAELAILDVERDSQIYGYLKQVMVAGRRAKDLVRQILTFSRQTEKELKPLRLVPILNEVYKLLRASLPTTIEMRQINKSESPVLADSTQVHQLIMNLCTNAAHAMERTGGLLTVELKDVQLDTDRTQRLSPLAPGPYIQLTVSDTGHGMTPAVMQRIFDPFFTTKEKGKGTGIGLSAVHGIVKSHAGKITVSSKPGKGSTFKVFLPRVEKDLTKGTPTNDTKPTGNEVILFVDDEPVIVDMGKEMLTRLGYKVNACTASPEALDWFKRQPEKCDLVVCDMTMPDLTGEELARKLRELRPDIPIILCTGYHAKISERTAQEMGVNAFLLKPLTMAEMGGVIRRVLDKNGG